jgi:hypothetical protein
MSAPKYCCDTMKRQMEHNCVKCMGQYACPDRVIKPPSVPGAAFGLYILDGGAAYYAIYFCPWCGARLASWCGASQQEQPTKEEVMEDERKKPIEGNVDSYREILEYRGYDRSAVLRLPSRAPITLQRYELVAVAMAVFGMLRDKFKGAAPEQVFDAIARIVSSEWKPSPQEVRDAGFLLNQELTLAGCATFEMVGYTLTELVVYYKAGVPNTATASAFLQNLPPSYRGVRVVPKAV